MYAVYEEQKHDHILFYNVIYIAKVFHRVYLNRIGLHISHSFQSLNRNKNNTRCTMERCCCCCYFEINRVTPMISPTIPPTELLYEVIIQGRPSLHWLY